jgi:hypothetical protein
MIWVQEGEATLAFGGGSGGTQIIRLYRNSTYHYPFTVFPFKIQPIIISRICSAFFYTRYCGYTVYDLNNIIFSHDCIK